MRTATWMVEQSSPSPSGEKVFQTYWHLPICSGTGCRSSHRTDCGRLRHLSLARQNLITLFSLKASRTQWLRSLKALTLRNHLILEHMAGGVHWRDHISDQELFVIIHVLMPQNKSL